LAASDDDERDSDEIVDASMHDGDAPESGEDASESDADAPEEGADDRPRLSPEEMRAWIARPDVIDRMKAAIGAVMPKRTPDGQREEVLHRAFDRALTTEARPFVGGNTLAWFGRVAETETLKFFRERKAERKHLNRSKDVARLPQRPEDAAITDVPQDETLLGWLQVHGVRSETDKETLELIIRKARGKMTSAEIAKDAGISANAFDKRVQAFHNRYAPLRERYLKRRNAVILALKVFFVSAVVIGVAFAIWKWVARDDIRRDPDEHRRGRTPPAPSASATPGPTFDQALPPPTPLPSPPPRLKP
jgi:DNA-directed RNA polymerase specialized sigma24 family protein